MDQIISRMISLSTKKEDNKGNTTHKVQIQPLIDEGFNMNSIRQIAKKFGYRLIDTDTKLSITAKDLRKALSDYFAELQRKAA